jgi:hypothetical protein
MSYNLTLDCGCSVYVSCDPQTRTAHTRILERRGLACTVRRHEVGLRLYLWDLLPDRGVTALRPTHTTDDAVPRW